MENVGAFSSWLIPAQKALYFPLRVVAFFSLFGSYVLGISIYVVAHPVSIPSSKRPVIVAQTVSLRRRHEIQRQTQTNSLRYIKKKSSTPFVANVRAR